MCVLGEAATSDEPARTQPLTQEFDKLGHLASHHDTLVVVACCDNDPQKVGRRIGGIVIRASSDVARVVRETRAEIGILAVPAAAAQSNYEALVEAGIEGCSTSPRRPSSRAPACG